MHLQTTFKCDNYLISNITQLFIFAFIQVFVILGGKKSNKGIFAKFCYGPILHLNDF